MMRGSPLLVAVLVFMPLTSGCVRPGGPTPMPAVRQQPLPEPGALVRVWYVLDSETGRRRVRDEGTLVRLTADTIVVTVGELENALAAPLASVSTLEVWQHKSRVGQGAGIGMLVGLGLGAVVGYAAGGDSCSSSGFICFRRESTAAVGALGGLVVGLLAGVVIGAADSGSEWEEVGLDRLR